MITSTRPRWVTVIVKRRPNHFKRNYLIFRFPNLKRAKDFISTYGYSDRVVKIYKEPINNLSLRSGGILEATD